jgi:hypothetical protein
VQPPKIEQVLMQRRALMQKQVQPPKIEQVLMQRWALMQKLVQVQMLPLRMPTQEQYFQRSAQVTLP